MSSKTVEMSAKKLRDRSSTGPNAAQNRATSSTLSTSSPTVTIAPQSSFVQKIVPPRMGSECVK